MLHLFEYVAVIAAPLPIAREPQMLGPGFYSRGVAWSLLSNFVQVAAGFHLDRFGRVQMLPSTVYLVVSVAVTVAVCGAALVLNRMDCKYRATFYRHRTLRRTSEYWTRAAHSALGVGLDASRAEVLSHYSSYHWPPHNKIKAWLQWPEWEKSPEPPAWFTGNGKTPAFVVPRNCLASRVSFQPWWLPSACC